jgi:RimJ/RimL family protein N-acetyltransferase
MQRPVPTVLERAGVRLEPLSEQHGDGLAAAVAAAPDAFPLAGPVSGDSTLGAWIAQALEEQAAGGRLPFAVLVDGTVAGSSSYLDIAPADGRIEIGHTWYGAPWRGTRLNPTAKLLLLEHAFETLGATRVALKTDARNEHSRRAIARAGASFEGILRKHSRRADGPGLRDVALFAVIDDDWPRVRALLEQRIGLDAGAGGV